MTCQSGNWALNEEKVDLSYFKQSMTFGAKWAGLSISETETVYWKREHIQWAVVLWVKSQEKDVTASSW